MKKEIITCVAEHLNELIQDAFGNYAVQHILEVTLFFFLRWRFNDALSSVQMFKSACGPIFEAILPNIVEYSNQKFSSNVVEKAIETASQVNPIFWRSNLISNVGVQNKINRWYSQKWETYWPDDQQVWEFCDK